MHTDINRDIIERSKRGDVRAQYELYNRYAKAMLNTSYRIVNNVETAEDILQEAFTEAFKKLGSFRYKSTFGAWLKRIVINKSINELKRRKTELVFVEDISSLDSKEMEKDDDYEINVKAIKKAIGQLPDGSRTVFSLYLMEGYTHKEIAEILNVSESNSKSQYLRAKRKIKELLKGGSHEN